MFDTKLNSYYIANVMTDFGQLKVIIAQPLFPKNMTGFGAGNVFGNDYNWSQTLPNIGLGARLALDGRTVLRIDYGWGKHSNGLIINVNEAF